MGIDPGRHGCQHYEASQLLFYETPINPGACLVLWQVGLVGDCSMKRFATGPEYRQVLVDVLSRDYPLDHEVIVYRGATLPIEQPRIRHVLLRDLPATAVSAEETVVLPPILPLRANAAARQRLAVLDRAVEAHQAPDLS